ncbi:MULTISPECIES: twin-arginine translocase subunit TatC [Parachlamydia]|jgi:sec-independent protein translocase protein TatC|uniref:twin-arginine translocase subunit TatC n=1 Tax=Parachlamydia TaxID=83551 RepID=UPI0001C17A76|nr:twin-arginine translocase subunit TatC [Parachlamydia acanthamoebae]EFB42016.1 hypothetical protein pah_c016o053 [Parachlamydia acanthamoebae str. Hall's coccus]
MKAPFWDHVEELRKTLLRCLFSIGVGFLLCLLAYKPLLHFLIQPLQSSQWTETSIVRKKLTNSTQQDQVVHLTPDMMVAPSFANESIKQNASTYVVPAGQSIVIDIVQNGSKLILTSPLEGISTVVKLSFWFGLAGSSPLWIWSILRFISPALSINKQRLLLKAFFLTIALFGLGVYVAYRLTIPLANAYFMHFNRELGINLWSLSSYLEYTIILMLGNGLAFEGGAILLLLVQGGVISQNTMRKYRRHAIVGIFLLSAILTPPDVLSQILLAVPLICFYELAILYANWLDLKNKNEEKIAFDN